MSEKSDFLETEETIHALLEELKKLKSAADQIEDIKKSAGIIQESAEKVITSVIGLVNKGNTILSKIEEVKFPEQFNKIEQLNTNSIERDNTILSRIIGLQKQNRYLTILFGIVLLVQLIGIIILILK